MGLLILCEDIILPIFAEWIEIVDLAVLDTAICSSKCRKYFLQLFTSDNFLQIGTVMILPTNYYVWLDKKGLKVRNMNLSNYYNQPLNKSLANVLQKQPCLKQLLAKYCHNLDKIVSNYCSNIYALKLTNGHDLSDKEFEIIKKLNGLFSIGISGCRLLTNNVSMTIAAHCPRLQRLDITGCDKMTSPSYETIARGCPDLWELVANKHVNDDAVLALTEHCTMLKVLKMKHSGYISNVSLRALSGCRQLETLHMLNNTVVTDVGLSAMAEKCTKLKHLAISYCTKITDTSILSLAQHCPQLQSLAINGCTAVTDDALTQMAESCLDLRDLVLASCFMVTDRTVTRVAAFSRQLVSINVNHCVSVTSFALTSLVRSCPLLEKVYAFGLKQDLRDVATSMIRSTPGLQRVDYSCLTDDSPKVKPTVSVDRSGCRNSVLTVKYYHKQPKRVATGLMDSTAATTAQCLLSDLLSGCGSGLLELSLAHDHTVSDSQLLSSAEHNPLLRSVRIHHCGLITGPAIAQLAVLCSNLTALQICSCGTLTSEDLVNVLEGRCGPRLTTLEVVDCERITDTALIKLSQCCSDITSLNISGCVLVTDDGLQPVICGCLRLRRLDVSFTKYVTEDTVYELCQVSRCLTHLNIRDCEGIREGEAANCALKLVAAMPGLIEVLYGVNESYSVLN